MFLTLFFFTTSTFISDPSCEPSLKKIQVFSLKVFSVPLCCQLNNLPNEKGYELTLEVWGRIDPFKICTDMYDFREYDYRFI